MNRPLLGNSPSIQKLIQLIQRVSSSKTNVLIIGESGTGKELVARMIHESGPLKDQPFVPVNCGAIAENLIESEMFGHQKGSFTGAVAEKKGLFEVANRGTLFLDEVGELPLSMQVKLLRAIQERVIRRVGSIEDISIDVRILAATNRDLEAAVRQGTFREDLYYRLNVILIHTPPLRERKGDVEILAQRFLEKFSQQSKKKIEGFHPDAMATLVKYSWPGNVRELENTLERAVTLESGYQISLESLPEALKKRSAHQSQSQAKAEIVSTQEAGTPDFSKGPIHLDSILGEVERSYLLSALEHSGGVKRKAADLLGITFRSLRYRLKKLGIPVDDEAE